MAILLKATAGLFAGAVVGVLTFAFWPRLEPAVVNLRPAVEQPKFVATALVKPPEPVAAAADPAASADKAALEKLALALRGSASPADGDSAATRSLIATPVGAGNAGSPEKALRLRAEGLVALATGDIAGARAFLEGAADSGDARSLIVLGDTYDPATLTRLGAIGLKGDPARAREYYARALSAGVPGARDRIALRDAPQNN